IPPAERSFRGYDVDAGETVYVGEFPQVLRIEPMTVLNYGHVRVAADASVSGGMDKETSLAWIICGNGLLSSTALRKCINIDLTSVKEEIFGDVSSSSFEPKNWLVRFVNWDSLKKAVGIIERTVDFEASFPLFETSFLRLHKACNLQSLSHAPSLSSPPAPKTLLMASVFSLLLYMRSRLQEINQNYKNYLDRPLRQFFTITVSELRTPNLSNSFDEKIQLPEIPLSNFINVAPEETYAETATMMKIKPPGQVLSDQLGPDGLEDPPIFDSHCGRGGRRMGKSVFLEGHSICMFSMILNQLISQSFLKKLVNFSQLNATDYWSSEFVRPLRDCPDLFTRGAIRVFDPLRHTEYSLLTMQYKSGVDITKPIGKQILEKKAPNQVIIPKLRVEDEEYLFSMRLKVGVEPANAVIILSGDGTATISFRSYDREKFDLPKDAGKVLDVTVFPSLEKSIFGTWVVLTEKAGVWVEPPERSLSRKWSSNNGSLQEERSISVAGNIAAKRSSSEAWEAGDRQRAGLTEGAHCSPQDEESEYLLSQFFHEFLLSGQVDGVLDKLKNSRAFEREGEINVFARMSKSIVVSTQLVDKQQKHKRFLQFLSLSKCHEELCHRQRQSMQIIMEHGEKLASMIQLRELLNAISHATEYGIGSYYDSDARTSGALWDLIQLVGERARRNTVLLMDRDNAEVFYSKVSELEELFHCLEGKLDHIITQNMPIILQSQRACELANACVTIFRAAVDYRADHHLWYPPPEGLTPWYSNFVVCSGLWNLASVMLQLLSGTERLKVSVVLDFYSNLVVLSEILLESYSNAITAKVDRKEDHRSLLEEYSKCRDTLLDSLYKQVKDFIHAKLQDSPEENEELNKDTLMTFSSKLLSIAKRHEGYQTMWNICCDLNDFELLHESHHENIGPKGGFSCFVFIQFSELMRQGEKFLDELATILRQHPDLLWLHELFLRQFSSPSETLHALSNLSLPKDKRSVSDTDETEPNGPQPKLTLAWRKHFLNLAKLSAMAGREVGDELKVKRIEADLNFLQVQEEIMRFLHDDDMDMRFMAQQLLDPKDLIRTCLRIKKRELSLRPFDIFLWMNASFLRTYAMYFEECWKNAASQDDWERLYSLSMTEGWSDERTFKALEKTVLFHAARKCYGPRSKNFNVKFDEVLPLRKGRNIGPSVEQVIIEEVIMEHKDYPHVGKLMLTAILLGSV
ncbi:Nuclear pore complex protein NUP133, partial [Striga hermonthica]